jgi:hypothetical protein
MDTKGRLRIALRPGASVFGKAFAAKGVPLAHEPLWLKSSSDYFPEAKTDAQGAYAWEGLEPGQYVIRYPFHYIPGPLTYLTRRFELAAGEQKQLNLGDDLGPCALHGKVVCDRGPLGRQCVVVKPDFEWDYEFLGSFLDDNGAYRINGLCAGQYYVTLSRVFPPGDALDSVESFLVEAQGDTELNLRLAASHTYRRFLERFEEK